MRYLNKHCKINLTKLLTSISISLWSSYLLAAPPFITNNAETTEYKHLEIYPALQFSQTKPSRIFETPSIELDYGLLPNLQLHLIPALTSFFPRHGGSKATGLGDTEVGVEYRFIQEGKYTPQVSIFPLFELPTGSANRNLGNGQIWYQFPIAIQKSWGNWTTYGEVGYALNHASNSNNFWFGGAVLQRNITKKLMLGAEIYSQGSTGGGTLTQSNGAYTLLNIGGSYNFKSNAAVLFSVGHNIIGAEQLYSYLGLYWNLAI